MKFHKPSARTSCKSVALFTRAWIEIDGDDSKTPARAVALFTRAWIEIASRYLRFQNRCVALFTRAWIEIPLQSPKSAYFVVALFTRAWIEIAVIHGNVNLCLRSPSSRGRGLKSYHSRKLLLPQDVALFTRAWIEITLGKDLKGGLIVALFTRAWIEINAEGVSQLVALGRPLHEGVD